MNVEFMGGPHAGWRDVDESGGLPLHVAYAVCDDLVASWARTPLDDALDNYAAMTIEYRLYRLEWWRDGDSVRPVYLHEDYGTRPHLDQRVRSGGPTGDRLRSWLADAGRDWEYGPDAHTMSFKHMTAEAEAEMKAWDEMLHPTQTSP